MKKIIECMKALRDENYKLQIKNAWQNNFAEHFCLLFVFDDYKTYDMGLIGKALSYYNFNEVKKGDNKIIYAKKI